MKDLFLFIIFEQILLAQKATAAMTAVHGVKFTPQSSGESGNFHIFFVQENDLSVIPSTFQNELWLRFLMPFTSILLKKSSFSTQTSR